MTERKKHQVTEYEKCLREYHKASPRHVRILETNLPEDEKRHLFHQADLLRQCGNELLGIIKRNLEQLLRTKKYRGMRKSYSKINKSIKALSNVQKRHLKDLQKDLRTVSDQMNEMQEVYHVTWDHCRNAMKDLRLKYQQTSIVALSRAEDIWVAVSKILYSDGERLHFKKRGELLELRAKQIHRGIVGFMKNGSLEFHYGRLAISLKRKKNDLWLMDELEAVEAYLKDPDFHDAYAIDRMEYGEIISTYRPCYASIVCKTIRGKLRVYLHLTVEGLPFPKRTKNGVIKYSCGDGIVGCDIGTQTIAYTSDHAVGLENLAERGNSIRCVERQQRLVQRAMDRSRRAMNPENYNEDGTIRKGKKTWIKSKRYQKLQLRYRELCHVSAENRKLAIHEQVHKMRSLGSIFVTEAKNAKKLQKRANAEDPLDKNGKPKRKKRFGRSIKNRCPGYFQAKVQQLFESTGGTYIEVPSDYRASQYDHTADVSIKKKLSQRMYNLKDGTKVQRDWYSSFLLYCIDLITKTIDRQKCLATFETQLNKEQDMIEEIICSRKHVKNSGIRAVA